MTMTPDELRRESPLYRLMTTSAIASNSFAELESLLMRQLTAKPDLPRPRPTPVRALRDRAGRA